MIRFNLITGLSSFGGSSLNSSSISSLPISVSGVLGEEREIPLRSRSNGEVDLGASDDSFELMGSEETIGKDDSSTDRLQI